MKSKLLLFQKNAIFILHSLATNYQYQHLKICIQKYHKESKFYDYKKGISNV